MTPLLGTNEVAPAPTARILLVDDRPANLLALQAILEPLHCEIVTATSGKEALRQVLALDLAIILMDVKMPGLDGLETAMLIRERERTRHLPIIFLTAGTADSDHVLRGYALGAFDYLQKPFAPEVLRSKVALFVELYVNGVVLARQSELLREREREALERRSELRFRALVDALPQCVWSMGPDGHIHYTNQVHYDAGQPLGFLIAIHADDREAVRAAWARAARVGAAFEIQFRLQRDAGGEQRWHIGRALPQRDSDGNVVGWIATAADIHEQKLAEQTRVELLAREHVARREAEAASRMKDEFLAILSHELRTPLNAILGWSHLLRQGELDAEKRARGLEAIERNARAQTAIVGDLLDVSRIISGKLRLDVRPVRLIALIQAAMESVRPMAEGKGIRLSAQLAPEADLLSGDAYRLQQVVSNLLVNAVKFTGDGGAIEVRLTCAGERAEIVVADSGAGIAAAFLPHVFDRFRQADGSSTRAHGGLGLGLAIVRHLVELHGGTVGVDSEGEGRGATFSVQLPRRLTQLDDGEARPVAPAAADPSCIEGVRVLVVDDEEDARELLAMVLSQRGATVRTVGSAEEALAAMQHDPPDVLVSDIGMPAMDGYELLRRLRARGLRLPAIALTGYAGGEDARRALRAGYQRHLVKPVEPAELLRQIALLARSCPDPA